MRISSVVLPNRLPNRRLPHRNEIERGTFSFSSVENLPAWDVVLGLQFENLIVNNAMSLLPFLHLGAAVVESAAPYRNSRKDASGRKTGCQIDLLIQTGRAAYVVEIKHRHEIRAQIEDEVGEKLRQLPLRKGVSARPMLVYDGELAKSVEGSGFFDAIVPARKLLGL